MKILVTGGTGMLGSSFKRLNTNNRIILVGSKDANLCIKGEFTKLLIKFSPDAIIHLAAKVGGVKGNTDYIADFYSQNTLINYNVINESHKFGIKKIISLLSTCIYPENSIFPLTENQIHNGPPHKSNYGYAYAKRMLDIHSKSLRQQYGKKYICAIPNNLYGENDNFDLENSHVIPAMIRKIYEAKISRKNVELWGDGSPLREFTYSKDIAQILLLLMERYNCDEPINIGNTNEFSIKETAEIISRLLNYEGNIIWNFNQPSGQYRKPSSNKKLLDLGWEKENYTSFKDGLKFTVDWFLKNYPNIRGI